MSIPPVAVVTGAGSGIGRAVVEALAAIGYRITLVGRDEQRLQATLDAISADIADPPEVLLVPADLADEEQAASVIALTAERWGRIDALVNNAGMVERVPIAETTEDVLYRHFSVNVFGPAFLIARAWPLMTRQRTGVIVNISSMSSIDPFPGLSVYAASKSALESLTRSVLVEGGAHGIRAFSITPGAVETPMLRSLFSKRDLPETQTLDPAEVAGVVVDCIQGRRRQEEGERVVVSV